MGIESLEISPEFKALQYLCGSGCRCDSGRGQYVISPSGLSASAGLSYSLVLYESLGCSAPLFFPRDQHSRRVSRDRPPRIYKALRAGLQNGLVFITRQPFVYIEVLKLLLVKIK